MYVKNICRHVYSGNVKTRRRLKPDHR